MPLNLNTYRAVVRLTNTSRFGGGLGSGVAFSPTGLILTNNHVVEDADFGTSFGKLTVQFLEDIDRPPSKEAPAELVVRNELYDLAVVRTKTSTPHYIDILKSPATTGDLVERPVRVLGYPPLGGSTITITRGIVSGFDEARNLKTDAEINPGNSGGAALDDVDSFLGIPSFISVEAQGKLGFVISADRVRDWFVSVLKNGIPKTSEELEGSFSPANLNVVGDNLDVANKYPRILGKFAAVEKLLSNHDYENAKRQLAFILDKRPRSALAHHYLGNAYLGLGRYVDAVNRYRMALSYNPYHIPAMGNLGVALVQLGRFNEALACFDLIIDTTDNSVELQLSFAKIAEIYDVWQKPAVSALYRTKAAELEAAAAARLADYRAERKPGDKIVSILDAIVESEIELGEK